MKLLDHIENLRKAQLQEYFLRWFPKEEMTSDKDKLVEQLKIAMCDPKVIRERFDRLPRSSQDFLTALLTLPNFQGTTKDIVNSPQGRSIESYEVENLIKNLLNEGWMVGESNAKNGVRFEVYTLPEEIGEGLSITVDIEHREATLMLSLSVFLKQQAGSSSAHSRSSYDGSEDNNLATSLTALVEPRNIEQRIEKLEDKGLRKTVRAAILHHGGILPISVWKSMSDVNSDHLHRKDWRDQLEKNYLGTTGVFSLKTYGIDLEEECLVIFQEVVQSQCSTAMASKLQNDKEYSLGVDLLIDIRRLLEVARSESLEVTREGTVFKKTEERLASQLLTTSYKEVLEGSSVHHIINLCKRLRVLDQGDHYLRPDPIRRKGWLKKRLSAMIRDIFDIYQNNYRGNRCSFHQRMIRQIFQEELVKHSQKVYKANSAKKDSSNGQQAQQDSRAWLLTKPLFTATISRFLSTLEEQKIAQTLQELKMEDFHNETLIVPLDRLYKDLSYWVVHRLALLGLVDIGSKGGNFESLKISTVGCRFFKIDLNSNEEGKLVVNPDFEILHFPGSKTQDEINYIMGAFTDRSESDYVKRYRITPESIKRGIISGYSAEDIMTFLTKRSEDTIPPNVSFSIREWAEGIEPILRQRVLLLKSQTKKGADHLVKILEENEISQERVGERAVVVRGLRNERKIRDLQDYFQNAGLILE